VWSFVNRVAERTSKLTPVHLTFSLTLELFTAASHSPPTFRAHPVQNAGDHVCSPFKVEAA
jgi:hypothetical protein